MGTALVVKKCPLSSPGPAHVPMMSPNGSMPPIFVPPGYVSQVHLFFSCGMVFGEILIYFYYLLVIIAVKKAVFSIELVNCFTSTVVSVPSVTE